LAGPRNSHAGGAGHWHGLLHAAAEHGHREGEVDAIGEETGEMPRRFELRAVDPEDDVPDREARSFCGTSGLEPGRVAS